VKRDRNVIKRNHGTTNLVLIPFFFVHPELTGVAMQFPLRVTAFQVRVPIEIESRTEAREHKVWTFLCLLNLPF